MDKRNLLSALEKDLLLQGWESQKHPSQSPAGVDPHQRAPGALTQEPADPQEVSLKPPVGSYILIPLILCS